VIKLKNRGKVVNRALYRVDIGYGFHVARMERWRVSSIKRPPRRELSHFGIPPDGKNTAPKTVYVRQVGGEAKDDFWLEDWPGSFSLSPKAAWADAVKRLTKYRADHVRFSEECKGEGNDCDDCDDNCKAALGMITRSLNKAKKESLR